MQQNHLWEGGGGRGPNIKLENYIGRLFDSKYMYMLKQHCSLKEHLTFKSIQKLDAKKLPHLMNCSLLVYELLVILYYSVNMVSIFKVSSYFPITKAK